AFLEHHKAVGTDEGQEDKTYLCFSPHGEVPGGDEVENRAARNKWLQLRLDGPPRRKSKMVLTILTLTYRLHIVASETL
ncbi:Hypothetical predicted protein, partial [Marmota monax]